jgi:folate-binding protein YgfZ
MRFFWLTAEKYHKLAAYAIEMQLYRACIIESPMNSVLTHENAPATADLKAARREFQALVSGAGLYDSSSKGSLSISGDDRVRWLNGMVTNNVRDLKEGHGVYAFLLNPQGRILGDLHIYNRGESLAADSNRFELPKLLEIFDRYIIMDDVEIADISDQSRLLGISGPGAEAALRAAGLEIPALQSLDFVTLSWRGIAVTVTRGDDPGVANYELRIAPPDIQVVKAELVKAGAIPVSETALEWLRIASGIPRYGTDIRERDLAQETGQDRALSFTKGCYVGQEIVERIRSRGAVHRMFTGFLIEGGHPDAGTELMVDGKKAAEITSVADIITADGRHKLALGYVRREMIASSKTLDGGTFKATVNSLPFSGFFQQ